MGNCNDSSLNHQLFEDPPKVEFFDQPLKIKLNFPNQPYYPSLNIVRPITNTNKEEITRFDELPQDEKTPPRLNSQFLKKSKTSKFGVGSKIDKNSVNEITRIPIQSNSIMQDNELKKEDAINSKVVKDENQKNDEKIKVINKTIQSELRFPKNLIINHLQMTIDKQLDGQFLDIVIINQSVNATKINELVLNANIIIKNNELIEEKDESQTKFEQEKIHVEEDTKLQIEESNENPDLNGKNFSIEEVIYQENSEEKVNFDGNENKEKFETDQEINSATENQGNKIKRLKSGRRIQPPNKDKNQERKIEEPIEQKINENFVEKNVRQSIESLNANKLNEEVEETKEIIEIEEQEKINNNSNEQISPEITIINEKEPIENSDTLAINEIPNKVIKIDNNELVDKIKHEINQEAIPETVDQLSLDIMEFPKSDVISVKKAIKINEIQKIIEFPKIDLIFIKKINKLDENTKNSLIIVEFPKVKIFVTEKVIKLGEKNSLLEICKEIESKTEERNSEPYIIEEENYNDKVNSKKILKSAKIPSNLKPKEIKQENAYKNKSVSLEKNETPRQNETENSVESPIKAEKSYYPRNDSKPNFKHKLLSQKYPKVKQEILDEVRFEEQKKKIRTKRAYLNKKDRFYDLINTTINLMMCLGDLLLIISQHVKLIPNQALSLILEIVIKVKKNQEFYLEDSELKSLIPKDITMNDPIDLYIWLLKLCMSEDCLVFFNSFYVFEDKNHQISKRFLKEVTKKFKLNFQHNISAQYALGTLIPFKNDCKNKKCNVHDYSFIQCQAEFCITINFDDNQDKNIFEQIKNKLSSMFKGKKYNSICRDCQLECEDYRIEEDYILSNIPLYLWLKIEGTLRNFYSKDIQVLEIYGKEFEVIAVINDDLEFYIKNNNYWYHKNKTLIKQEFELNNVLVLCVKQLNI